MNPNLDNIDVGDEAIFNVEVSDDALEAAASTMRGPAFSLPTPTVSVIFACCGNDVSDKR